MKKSLSFWTFVLAPWILEVLFGTRFFSTLAGSTLWTLILLLGLIRSQVVDLRMKNVLFASKATIFVIWNLLWVLHLRENAEAHFGAGIPDLESKFWIQAHVALLTAGIASSIATLAAAWMALIQEERLQSDSWSRRGQGILLPSLESLSKAARLSARTGLILWSSGSVLAALTLYFRQSERNLGISEILLDDQILGVASFWCLQAATVFGVPRFFKLEKRNRGYLIFSAFFLVFFVLWSVTKESNFHSPLRWLAP